MMRIHEAISMSAGMMEDVGVDLANAVTFRSLSILCPFRRPGGAAHKRLCAETWVYVGAWSWGGRARVWRMSSTILPAVDPSSPLLACWRLFALSPRSRIYLVSGARACPLYSQIVIRFGSGKTRIGKSMGWVHGYEGLST